MAKQVVESVIDRTRVRLNIGAHRPAGAQWVFVDVKTQCQCHSNWCWAAVTSMVSYFYNPLSLFDQATVANTVLDRKDCGDAPCNQDDSTCNQPYTLGSPLNYAGCLDRCGFRPATPKEVREEVGKNRPVCLRTKWAQGGRAHFVAISGYFGDPVHIEDPLLRVEDPFFGRISGIAYRDVLKNYAIGGGVWTHTYYTRSSDDDGAEKEDAN